MMGAFRICECCGHMKSIKVGFAKRSTRFCDGCHKIISSEMKRKNVYRGRVSDPLESVVLTSRLRGLTYEPYFIEDQSIATSLVSVFEQIDKLRF